MKRTLFLVIACLGQAVPGLAAEAQPADPAAPVPAAPYRSAFEGYRPFKEEQIVDWRTLNAEVGAAGGHIGIMGGAGGHAGHGANAAKPPAGKPVTTEGGQTPVRGAPKAPEGRQPDTPKVGGTHGQH